MVGDMREIEKKHHLGKFSALFYLLGSTSKEDIKTISPRLCDVLRLDVITE